MTTAQTRTFIVAIPANDPDYFPPAIARCA